MRDMPDNSVDLCLTDPPYGINAGKMQLGNSKNKKWVKKEWDNEPPKDEYFTELMRVSKNQIIWGGNYFKLPNVKGWIVWDKNNGNSDFADGELAWSSINKPLKIKKIHWCGIASNREDTSGKLHPTQKPVALFKWCLDNYSKEGDVIFDPFCGSGTTAIACHTLKRKFICVDKEKEYIDIAKKRYAELTAQQDLFIEPKETIEQERLGF